MIPYEAIVECVINGVRFSYESYDHKKAIEEMRNNKTLFATTINNCYHLPPDMWIIPDEVKQNNIVWRIGKLREVYFNKNGRMCRFKIGQRWYKNFTLEDFGVKVKPMIFKGDDKYDLIIQGLAVEETL
jgi:hypothetical protein